MRSPRKVLIEKIRSRAQLSERFVDMAAQIRVWRRTPGDGPASPAELLPRMYGGRYDTWGARYVGEAQPIEISAHPGQLELLTFKKRGVTRVLVVGAAGSGKTESICLRLILEGLDRPGRAFGLVGAVDARTKLLWKKFLEVCPQQWIASIRPGDQEITLKNGTLYQFRSAKASSKAVGTPLQGYDWDGIGADETQNFTDESMVEMALRGRRSADEFCVWCTATNQLIPDFQDRLAEWKEDEETSKVIFSSGFDNSFIRLSHWEIQRKQLSKADYDRFIIGGDVGPENRIYAAFSLANIRQLDVGRDITGRLCRPLYGTWQDPTLGVQNDYRFIVGTDFGKRTGVSVVLRAFDDGEGGHIWFIVGELTVEGAVDPGRHARELKAYMLERFGAQPREYVVIGDPHYSKHASDGAHKTDYDVFRDAGFTIHKASGTGKQIDLGHRYAMVNALLEDADGKRRLFVLADEHGKPVCKQVVKSFQNYRWRDDGQPDQNGKRAGDLSHWTDAPGYGLYPIEKIRGSAAIRFGSQTRS